MHTLASLSAEDEAELARLRRLLHLDALRQHPAFAARVLARHFGPMSVRKTFTVNKGFLDGAMVDTPAVTQAGVVGRVMRSAPHAATVLMVTDPGFRVAVISQESRTPGILTGSASEPGMLEVLYVSQTARLKPGELLITAGVGNDFPKGIPAGMVTRVEPGNETLFQKVNAHPVTELDKLEEVLLIDQDGPPLVPTLPGPPEPDVLRPREQAPPKNGILENDPAKGAGSFEDPAAQTQVRDKRPAAQTPAPRPARRKNDARPAAMLDALQPKIPLTAPLALPAP